MTIIVIISSILVILYLLLGLYFFNFSQNPKISKKKLFKQDNKQFPYLDEDSKMWFEKTSPQDIYISSIRNAKLHAHKIYQKKRHNWIIITHGYTNCAREMLMPAKHFYELGYNILLIDQRAHGLSSEKYSTMGYYESKDLCNWIAYLNEQYNNIKIILYGVSMGATTVMLSTTNKLPNNVILAIEDSGFISIYDQFYKQLKYLKFYPRPIIFAAFLVSVVTIKFNIYKANIKKNFPKNAIPMLFIHGNKDRFVPIKAFEEAYDKYQYKKEKMVIDGAKHMQAMKTDPNQYWKKIDSFIKKYN